MSTSEAQETVDAFRLRARRWLADSMPLREPGISIYGWQSGEGEEDPQKLVSDARELQRRLYEGGFAGIAFPRLYGGQGLSFDHARVFNEEGARYELPVMFGVTLGIVAPTLLDHGTEEQRQQYIPPMLRGEDLWVQLLSEPTNGSDLAGALTRAQRDGEEWVLSGSKVWSTGAQHAAYGLCLARTSWDVPKHRGLSVFVVPMHHKGVNVAPIKQSNGHTEFCEEFFDDVRLPLSHLVGEENDGWTVILSHLAHERAGSGGGGIMGGLGGGIRRGGRIDDLVALSKHRDILDEGDIRERLADVYVLGEVHGHLIDHVSAGRTTGQLPDAAAAFLKLYWGLRAFHRCEVGLEIGGMDTLVYGEDNNATRYGLDYIGARAFTVAGGTDEMQRNTISERLLGLPRDDTPERGTPFREVRTNVNPARNTPAR